MSLVLGFIPMKKALLSMAVAIGSLGFAAVAVNTITPAVASAAAVCNNPSVLGGPSAPPAGAITVRPGENLNTATTSNPAGSTFWLASGTHLLGTGEYDQVIAKTGNTYIGAPGAVLDGQRVNRSAFQPGWPDQSTHVTIKHLTIQNFVAHNNQAVVNGGSASNWTIERNTIHLNAGIGLFTGFNTVIRSNCIANNGQHGVGGYRPPPADGSNAIQNVLLDGNEIAGNNTEDWETQVPGCGCSGGIKFWDTANGTFTNNWVHHNKSVGVWADTNNVNFLFEGNLIEDNDAEGLFYETSYNATIRNNVFNRNNLVKGRQFQARGDNFPLGAIYLSEAGGDPRVPGTGKIEVTGNTFTDNWDGVVLWENADRFFNSPANTSGTSYVPKGGSASIDTCVAGTINNEPYYSDCRWKTQNVSVTNNTFFHNPANIGCTAYCGRNAVFSQYGTYPDWSPYKAWAVSDAITYGQNNVFSANSYAGPWSFIAHNSGQTLTPTAWQAAPYNQDAGSTFDGTQPTTTTTTTQPATTTTTRKKPHPHKGR